MFIRKLILAFAILYSLAMIYLIAWLKFGAPSPSHVISDLRWLSIPYLLAAIPHATPSLAPHHALRRHHRSTTPFWTWDSIVQVSTMGLVCIPLLIAYIRRVQERHTYWLAAILYGWTVPGFVLLMWKSWRGARGRRTSRMGNDSAHRIQLISEP